MKPVYADIQPASGSHIAGICSVYLIPRQWLTADPEVDYETGRVVNAVTLNLNRFWIRMDLLKPTYKFKEEPKDSKSGDFKEVTFTGDINFYNYQLQQQLETLRRCQLVVLLTDQNARRRIIGDTEAGMRMTYEHNVDNSSGEERASISFTMDVEDPAPFYNPDNTQEILYNLLQDIDGNFLLVE